MRVWERGQGGPWQLMSRSVSAGRQMALSPGEQDAFSLCRSAQRTPPSPHNYTQAHSVSCGLTPVGTPSDAPLSQPMAKFWLPEETWVSVMSLLTGPWPSLPGQMNLAPAGCVPSSYPNNWPRKDWAVVTMKSWPHCDVGRKGSICYRKGKWGRRNSGHNSCPSPNTHEPLPGWGLLPDTGRAVENGNTSHSNEAMQVLCLQRPQELWKDLCKYLMHSCDLRFMEMKTTE